MVTAAERAAGRSEDFYRAFLAGYGALFFAPSAPAGAAFLLATFAASPILGAAVMLGLGASTATAHALRRDGLEIEQGLYGFNGALAAFTVFAYPADIRLALALTPVAAALATWIQCRLLDARWVQRASLPLLSVPSLVVGFPCALLFARLGYEPYPAATIASFLTGASDLFRQDFYSTEMRTAASRPLASAAVLALGAIGFALHSRRLLLLALAGVALGSLIGFAFLGWYGASCAAFVGVTATPTFMALGGTFVAGGWRAWIFGSALAVTSFAAWFALGLVLREASLPPLTAPFCATALIGLALVRWAPRPIARFLPELVPLHRVATPEAAAKWAGERNVGLRYWLEVEQRALEARARRDIERARELVARSRRIVAITGAGVSTESGIPDYRTGAIAWKRYDTEHFRWERFVVSEESRKKYWEMSQDFFVVLRAAQPNAAHRAFAELARRGQLERVITQNVDRLHQRAGLAAERVIEIHGNEATVSCLACGKHYERAEVFRWIQGGLAAPYCTACQGILKPDSIAFGQPMSDEVSLAALRAVEGCDLLLVAGTSLDVQPVATLPLVALRAGKPLVIVNLQATDYDAFADAVLRGPVGVVLPSVVSRA